VPGREYDRVHLPWWAQRSSALDAQRRDAATRRHVRRRAALRERQAAEADRLPPATLQTALDRRSIISKGRIATSRQRRAVSRQRAAVFLVRAHPASRMKPSTAPAELSSLRVSNLLYGWRSSRRSPRDR